MAEKQLEARQKALRRTDYDSLSDGEEDRSEYTSFPSNSSTSSSSSSMRNRGGRQCQSVPIHEQALKLKSPLFDPYAPAPASDPAPAPDPSNTSSNVDSTNTSINPPATSLLDDESVHTTSSLIPGAAGFLEMEEEPPRETPLSPLDLNDDNEPIKTSSGLLLTHRRSPTNKKNSSEFDLRGGGGGGGGAFRNAQKDYFEVENGYWNDNSKSRRNTMGMLQARRFMSYVRIWVAISAVLLLVATGVLFHSFGHKPSEAAEDFTADTQQQSSVSSSSSSSSSFAQNNNNNNNAQVPLAQQQIILVPMENISKLTDKGEKQTNRRLGEMEPPSMELGFPRGHDNKKHRGNKRHSHQQQHGVRRVVSDLRDEFEAWVKQHGKTYHSHNEKEHRFHIWSDNHHKTIEKNKRHGPCKLTKQSLFGSNHFKDLSREEFKAKFLTGYKGPTTDVLEKSRKEMAPNVRKLSRHSGQVLNPKVHKMNIHETVKQRVLQQQQPVMASSWNNCAWYDISCYLRWIWRTAGVQFGSLVGTMEPAYDKDSYPNAVDWRDSGAVTDVRMQGDCGACWAITAVETVESAHFLSTGNLYDLAESEVITCDDTCEMCNGGWPQNAYEWVMDHGGLPLSNSFASYDGSTLLEMTLGLEGESDTWNEGLVNDYRQQVCPADDGAGNSNSHDSEDSYYTDGKDNTNYGDYSDQGRYGNIKGYGYATERCVCYSDGSGCDCDSQDEDKAVANLATYGPAVVCLEASLWQDYAGGIITAEMGCSNSFMDMNHCVQAVGYRFTDGTQDDEDGEDEENNDNKSQSGSGSQDSGSREGYWIIRNQWSSSWGMNGYAYVAMGDNTCGVLNDMTQAYL